MLTVNGVLLNHDAHSAILALPVVSFFIPNPVFDMALKARLINTLNSLAMETWLWAQLTESC